MQTIRSTDKRRNGYRSSPISSEADGIQKELFKCIRDNIKELFIPAHFVLGERHSIGRRAFIKTFIDIRTAIALFTLD